MRIRASCVALSVCLLVLLGSIGQAAYGQEAEEMQIVREAERLVQQQKPDDALRELEKVFDKTDSFAPAYFVAGMAYGVKDDAQSAFDNFVKAIEYQPGWGIAHREASFWAARMNNLEDSWDHAIKAHLAGTDMSDAFAGLQTMGPAPGDLDQRLAASRVWVAPMNVEQFLAHEENPFGRLIDSGGSSTDTANISTTRATSVGARVVSESSADRASVVRRTRQRLADSRMFGLVANQEQAQYILVIEADDIGEGSTNRPLEGYLSLLDARSGEQAHRLRIQMRNIASQSEINRDIDRIIGLLEDWAEKQGR